MYTCMCFHSVVFWFWENNYPKSRFSLFNYIFILALNL